MFSCSYAIFRHMSLFTYTFSPVFPPSLSCIWFGFTVAFELALNIYKNVKKVFMLVRAVS